MSIKVAKFLVRLGNGATILLLCVLAMQWFNVASPLINVLNHSMYSLVELVLVILILASFYANSVIKKKKAT